jgi:hypothetical protein
MFRKADRQDLQNIPAVLSTFRLRLDSVAMLRNDFAGISSRLNAIEQSQGKLLAGLNELQEAGARGNKWAVERTEALQKERLAQHAAVMLHLASVLGHFQPTTTAGCTADAEKQAKGYWVAEWKELKKLKRGKRKKS